MSTERKVVAPGSCCRRFEDNAPRRVIKYSANNRHIDAPPVVEDTTDTAVYYTNERADAVATKTTAPIGCCRRYDTTQSRVSRASQVLITESREVSQVKRGTVTTTTTQQYPHTTTTTTSTTRTLENQSAKPPEGTHATTDHTKESAPTAPQPTQSRTTTTKTTTVESKPKKEDGDCCSCCAPAPAAQRTTQVTAPKPVVQVDPKAPEAHTTVTTTSTTRTVEAEVPQARADVSVPKPVVQVDTKAPEAHTSVTTTSTTRTVEAEVPQARADVSAPKPVVQVDTKAPKPTETRTTTTKTTTVESKPKKEDGDCCSCCAPAPAAQRTTQVTAPKPVVQVDTKAPEAHTTVTTTSTTRTVEAEVPQARADVSVPKPVVQVDTKAPEAHTTVTTTSTTRTVEAEVPKVHTDVAPPAAVVRSSVSAADVKASLEQRRVELLGAMHNYDESTRARMTATSEEHVMLRASEAKPFIGVSIGESKTTRIVVDGVYEASPAYSVGMRPGDEIVTLGGIEIDCLADVRRAIKEKCRCGSTVVVQLRKHPHDPVYDAVLFLMTTDPEHAGQPYYFDPSKHKKLERRRSLSQSQ